jgi:drug/metabolite transporter (DMT)-like permease
MMVETAKLGLKTSTRSPWALSTTAILALLAVYVFWGSTAPAIRIGVASLPPWYMAGIRFLIAGGLLWLYVRARRVPLPTRGEWGGAAITGGFLLVLGNGVFTWCLQFIPSGIGALFFSLSPLFMAIFAFLLFRERIARFSAVGIALGFGGMVYLVAPSGASPLPLVPTIAAVFCSISWALGSVLQRRFVARDVVQASAMQMLVAGAVLTILGLARGEHLTLSSFQPHAVGALVFLIVCGSIVGYSCYLWLMRNVSTTLASTYAYVNPVVAIAIAVLLLHEALSPRTVVAGIVIVAGVALMVAAPKPALRPVRRAIANAEACEA